LTPDRPPDPHLRKVREDSEPLPDCTLIQATATFFQAKLVNGLQPSLLQAMAEVWLSAGYHHEPDDEAEQDPVALFDSLLQRHEFLVVTTYRGIW